MSRTLNTSPRNRALRATRAVTFGSLSLAACGTTPVEPPVEDAGSDTGTGDTAPPRDTSPDVVIVPDASIPDAEPDAITCSEIKDDQCPEFCTVDDDADCCENQNDEWTWCSFEPDWGCACAVEGPFAPPRFAA